MRQSFSHGRSKQVVVEKVKRRAVGRRGEGRSAGVERAPARHDAPRRPLREQRPHQLNRRPRRRRTVRRRAAHPDRGGAQRPRPRARRRAGCARRKSARSPKRRPRRRAAREVAEQAERDAAEARKREEEDRRRHEEEAKRKAEQEAKKRFGEEEAKPKAARAGCRARPGSSRPRRRKRRARSAVAFAAPLARRPPRSRRARGAEKPRGRLTLVTALSAGRGARAFGRRVPPPRAAAERSCAAEPKEKLIREVTIPETITIQELANRMAERAVDVIRLLMKQGQMVKITDVIDADTAQLVAEELGHTVRRVAESDVEEGLFDVAGRSRGTLVPRAAGRDHHGPRRPRQDVAARRDPLDRRGRRRGGRHHPAYRRLSGDRRRRAPRSPSSIRPATPPSPRCARAARR